MPAPFVIERKGKAQVGAAVGPGPPGRRARRSSCSPPARRDRLPGRRARSRPRADGTWTHRLTLPPGAVYRYRWTPKPTLLDPLRGRASSGIVDLVEEREDAATRRLRRCDARADASTRRRMPARVLHRGLLARRPRAERDRRWDRWRATRGARRRPPTRPSCASASPAVLAAAGRPDPRRDSDGVRSRCSATARCYRHWHGRASCSVRRRFDAHAAAALQHPYDLTPAALSADGQASRTRARGRRAVAGPDAVRGARSPRAGGRRPRGRLATDPAPPCWPTGACWSLESGDTTGWRFSAAATAFDLNNWRKRGVLRNVNLADLAVGAAAVPARRPGLLDESKGRAPLYLRSFDAKRQRWRSRRGLFADRAPHRLRAADRRRIGRLHVAARSRPQRSCVLYARTGPRPRPGSVARPSSRPTPGTCSTSRCRPPLTAAASPRGTTASASPSTMSGPRRSSRPRASTVRAAASPRAGAATRPASNAYARVKRRPATGESASSMASASARWRSASSLARRSGVSSPRVLLLDPLQPLGAGGLLGARRRRSAWS